MPGEILNGVASVRDLALSKGSVKQLCTTATDQAGIVAGRACGDAPETHGFLKLNGRQLNDSAQ